jgi:membrane fusion protein (multidrug efflux system)
MSSAAFRPLLVALICALYAGCWYGDSAQSDGTASADSTATDSTATDTVKAVVVDAVPVETAAATNGDISSFLFFNSTIETEAAVEVHSQLSGYLVKSVRVEEGDRVESGDTLVWIEDEELRVAAQETEVDLRHLQVGFDRTEHMHRRKLISDQEYEDKKFQLEQAKLRNRKAQMALEHAVIRAPFSGVLTERDVQVGTRVTSGRKLFDLIKLDDMIARVFVPGQYLTTIRDNQEAVITSEFLKDRAFDGFVKRISPVVDPKSGTFKVTIGIDDRWDYLRPGIFVDVRVVTDTHVDAVLVPKEAVVYDGGDRFIFIVEDSTATRVKLDAGFEDSKFVESLSLIEPDTDIIVVGQNGLKDKAKVKIVNAEETDGETVETDRSDADKG